MITIKNSIKSYSFQYSFAVDTGAINTYQAPFVLPGGCTVQLVSYTTLAALTSAGAATISLGTGTGANKTNWYSSEAIADFSLNATTSQTPFNQILIIPAGEKPSITIEAFALTAGILVVTVQYIEFRA